MHCSNPPGIEIRRVVIIGVPWKAYDAPLPVDIAASLCKHNRNPSSLPSERSMGRLFPATGQVGTTQYEASFPPITKSAARYNVITRTRAASKPSCLRYHSMKDASTSGATRRESSISGVPGIESPTRKRIATASSKKRRRCAKVSFSWRVRNARSSSVRTVSFSARDSSLKEASRKGLVASGRTLRDYRTNVRIAQGPEKS